MPADPLKTALEAHALRALADAKGAPPARALSVTVTAGDLSATLTVARLKAGCGACDGGLPPLTDCERDVVRLVAAAWYRWPTSKVLSELERHGLIHGESTVKRALARLVQLQILGNSKTAPRGYWLQERFRALLPGQS